MSAAELSCFRTRSVVWLDSMNELLKNQALELNEEVPFSPHYPKPEKKKRSKGQEQDGHLSLIEYEVLEPLISICISRVITYNPQLPIYNKAIYRGLRPQL